MSTTYTVKINKYVRENNPKLPETCGHKHTSEQDADECRIKFTGKLRIGWTDAIIIQNPNPAAVALGRLGGLSTSPKKSRSSAENGKLGGRPQKKQA
jgi:hypothetical protein